MPTSTLNVYIVQGFDEFMNLVMDDAEEIYSKTNKRRTIGELRTWKAMPNVAQTVNWNGTALPRCSGLLRPLYA